MRDDLQRILASPDDLRPLELLAAQRSGSQIVAGTLRAESGLEFPIVRGIPRFVRTEDPGQKQTAQAFAFKWGRRESYESLAVKDQATQWFSRKYGFASLEDWASHFADSTRILDIGCGSGFGSSLWLDSKHWRRGANWVGLEISEAIDVAYDRLGHIANTDFVQADALSLPFADETFDKIYSEGVLHHTASTRAAILSGMRVLVKGGEFDFYVYKRKAPVREFTDDFVREKIAPLSDQEAWDALRSMTLMGQALSELHTTVHIPEDVPLLGISAGEHDIQRLIYWHFAKLFWNPAMSLEENVHINFDWYRPRYAHRQTAAEVRDWCAEAGLAIEWFLEEESGFSVRAVRV